MELVVKQVTVNKCSHKLIILFLLQSLICLVFIFSFTLYLISLLVLDCFTIVIFVYLFFHIGQIDFIFIIHELTMPKNIYQIKTLMLQPKA